MDQGARYVVQGNGSGPALAIMDALEKHNARNKGKEVVYLNYAAVDPDLTNSKCSYWHFRLDADTSMKMEALTTYMKDGMKSGFDLGVTRAISDALGIPVIASGGVGNLQHLADGILEGHASAVLAASIFHFGEYTVPEAKAYMAERGIVVR